MGVIDEHCIVKNQRTLESTRKCFLCLPKCRYSNMVYQITFHSNSFVKFAFCCHLYRIINCYEISFYHTIFVCHERKSAPLIIMQHLHLILYSWFTIALDTKTWFFCQIVPWILLEHINITTKLNVFSWYITNRSFEMK